MARTDLGNIHVKIQRKIAVITVGRSDYGIYRPLLRRLAETPSVRPLIIAAGSHLDPAFGSTIDEIHLDGHPIAKQVPLDLVASSSRELVATAISQGVLGFTRGEISGILLGEMALQVLLALPLGLVFGRLLVEGVAASVDPEQWRMPVVITVRSYAIALLVALISAAISGLLVRRRLDKLDLIGVLKTRE